MLIRRYVQSKTATDRRRSTIIGWLGAVRNGALSAGTHRDSVARAVITARGGLALFASGCLTELILVVANGTDGGVEQAAKQNDKADQQDDSSHVSVGSSFHSVGHHD